MRTKWTPEMVARLRELAEVTTLATIARELGVSRNAVSCKASRLGIQIPRKMSNRLHCCQILKYWSEDEDRQLMMLAGYLSSKKIAARIGRSYMAVRSRAQKLGVRLEVRTGTLTDVARYLGVCTLTVAKHRKKLHLECRTRKSVAGADPEQIQKIAASILNSRINALKASPRRLALIAAGKDPDKKTA